MKILGLLNSDAHGGDADIPDEDLFPARMQAALAKALGVEVAVDVHSVWPTPRLPRLVGQWVADFEPDLVVFPVTGFWFLYESTPVRLERKLGWPGKIIGRISREAAAQPWLAHNRGFQWTRRKCQKAIGGQAWFSAEHVISVSQDAISAALRNEGAYVVVFGPGGGERWARDDRHRDELIARRRRVDAAMSAFCAAHHVEYWDEARLATLRPGTPQPRMVQGDDLHMSREGHRRMAEQQFGLAMGVVQRALAHSRGANQPEPVST